MRDWAGDAGVALVNIDEFIPFLPADVARMIAVERAKRTPEGYTAASDILRFAILHLFGGLYVDIDDRIGTGLTEQVDQGLKSAVGFAGSNVTNDPITMPAGHPLAMLHLRRLVQRSVVDQEDLTREKRTVRRPDRRVSRKGSMHLRTGMLDETLFEVGIMIQDIPKITAIHVGSAHTYKRGPRLPGLAPIRTETLEILQDLVDTLVRGLTNRRGDLYLIGIAPVIVSLPTPEQVWLAILRYLAARPRLAAKVRTATVFSQRDTGDLTLQLPQAAWELLGIDPAQVGQDGPGQWLDAEHLLPASLGDVDSSANGVRIRKAGLSVNENEQLTWSSSSAPPQKLLTAGTGTDVGASLVRPGETGPADSSITAGSPFHRSLDGMESLATGVASGVVKRMNLGGTGSIVERVTFHTGTRAVHTLTPFEQDTPADSWPVENARHEADAEQLAVLVARVVGVRVPTVYRTGDFETYTELIDGRTHKEQLDVGSTASLETHAASDAGRLLGLLDVLVSNGDRNAGTIVITPSGDIVGIFHAPAWGRPLDRANGGVARPPQRLNQPFSDHFISRREQGAIEWADQNDMSQRDIELIRRRLGALRGDFELLGRLDWWQATMDRLNEIGKRAMGSRDRLSV
jgi:hypothetical protein